ncbi:P-loop containing nucleoside triphosphate hydrolase protein [Desarmillaria tabescens]|uniref:P-loop containing nucleoside triphosphate hydrolase protein n=1 Tax=Armillaria tabescens TaxID=1929756 RepID=A0AA39JC47_ARMTA|nr:P-loop containing nucleoside triphosphate hydrolase protein [Desarmillaria tabescens]KAK0439091.1 P-loop containing nucleoside triphosphate hydrolase protein [Desarmillaria tabescens]
MGRIRQKARALCAIVFATYPELFEQPIWQEHMGFQGFDGTNIRHIHNADLPHIREFLEHIKDLPTEDAIVAVNSSTDDTHSKGRNAYTKWWMASGFIRRLNESLKRGLARADVNIKAMYRFTAKKTKFVTIGQFSLKEAEIAEAMFGSAYEDRESGSAREEFRMLLHFLLTEYINARRKDQQKAVVLRAAAKKEVDAAWKAFDNPDTSINAKQGKVILLALEKYERFIGWEATDAEMLEWAEHERMKGLFEKALVKTETDEKELKRRKKSAQFITGRLSGRNLAITASEKEIESLQTEYTSRLESIEDLRQNEEGERNDIDVNPGLPAHPALIGFDQWMACGDLGVEAWAKTSYEQLREMLRWPQGRPEEFNQFLNSSLVDYWDDENKEYLKKIPSEGDADNKVITLMWHQLVGITALVNMFWTAEEIPEGVPGALLADEVGLGKTAQMMGIIAFIIATRRTQLSKKKLPNVIANLPFFCGKKQIPNAPHLILVPTTLLGQCYVELKRWFRPHIIDIFVMPTMEKAWAEFFEGIDKSLQDPCHIVIVASHSTISQMARRNLSISSTKTPMASVLREDRHNGMDYAPLWSREFCSVIVDEGHNFRTTNVAYHGLNRIMEKAFVRIIATATPLYQSPRDLCNIGRLLRISAFLGEKAENAEAEMIRQIAKLRRDVTKEGRDIVIAYNNRLMHGEKVKSPFEAAYKKSADWVTDIQFGYNGRIIRRAVTSKRYQGNPEEEPKDLLSDLPPSEKRDILVHLTDAEKREMDAEMEKWSKRKEAGTTEVADAGAFLLNYRLAVAYPQSQRDPTSLSAKGKKKFPPFSSLEEYQRFPGAKLQTLINICKHFLAGDDALPPYTDSTTKQTVYPDFPELPSGVVRTYNKKLLVFHEFPMLDDLMKSALELNGIKVGCLNGTMRINARQEIVHEFIHGNSFRVLLLSQVGHQGLNLMRASIMISFDLTWSKVTEQQKEGRIIRHGQDMVVYIYRLVAANTIDVLMAQHAGVKAEQLKQFFTKPDSNLKRNREAFRIIFQCDIPADAAPAADGDTDDEEEGEEEGADEDTANARPAKKQRTNLDAAKSTQTHTKDSPRRRKGPIPKDNSAEKDSNQKKKRSQAKDKSDGKGKDKKTPQAEHEGEDHHASQPPKKKTRPEQSQGNATAGAPTTEADRGGPDTTQGGESRAESSSHN